MKFTLIQIYRKLKVFSVLILMWITMISAGTCSPIDYSYTSEIEGNWIWKESSFVSRGLKEPVVKTPATAGYQVELEISSTRIKLLINSTLSGEFEYHISRNENEYPVLEVDMAEDISGFLIASGPITFEGNQMIISGGYNDVGETQIFLKK
jgi:hypothetical protein